MMSKNKKTPTTVTRAKQDDFIDFEDEFSESDDDFDFSDSGDSLNKITDSMLGHFFTSALELTKVIAEKDQSIKTKTQILNAYKESLQAVMQATGMLIE